MQHLVDVDETITETDSLTKDSMVSTSTAEIDSFDFVRSTYLSNDATAPFGSGTIIGNIATTEESPSEEIQQGEPSLPDVENMGKEVGSPFLTKNVVAYSGNYKHVGSPASSRQPLPLQNRAPSGSNSTEANSSGGELSRWDHAMNNSLATRHSDSTVPTSNLMQRSGSPPLRVITANHSNNALLDLQQNHPHPSSSLSSSLSSSVSLFAPVMGAAAARGPPPLSSSFSSLNGGGNGMSPPRRTIFGMAVGQKYHTTTDFSKLHPEIPPGQQQQENGIMLGSKVRTSGKGLLTATLGSASTRAQPQPETTTSGRPPLHPKERSNTADHAAVDKKAGELAKNDVELTRDTADGETMNGGGSSLNIFPARPASAHGTDRVSELTINLPQSPPDSNVQRHRLYLGSNEEKEEKDDRHPEYLLHNLNYGTGNGNTKNHKNSCSSQSNGIGHDVLHHHHKYKRPERPHETIHAQSFLLGLAFCAVWSPNNLMAPNLTEMAEFFEFDNAQRDLYLGSYCALATGVLSFPIGAGIGILADMVNRKYLFCGTLAGGALAAMATGHAQSYSQLLLARLVNGGFMAGSVPVAFSFLGDLFAIEERNAASSGLTAMMGLGIILGQVYAGTVGPTLGWQHAFYVSSVVTLFFSMVCLALVQEPERGGKERVLQDMIRAGTRYEKKLSWQGCWHACVKNASNFILLWQGFFSSLPWGVIFVFLNDYLSQERGLSVPAATYLVFLFGLGCAAGGVLGGYWGQMVQRISVSYLPIFMGITTELGILPFLGLLNVKFPEAHGTLGILFAFGSGLVASLPSVNVRPCLINVNPPETRGAALTAANLLIQLGRGLGPSCVTMLVKLSRQQALNLTLIVFWTVAALQLVSLSKTLPKDQERMDAELARYAEMAIQQAQEKEERRGGAVGGGGKDEEEAIRLLGNKEEATIIFDDSTAPPLPSTQQSSVYPSYQSIPLYAGPQQYRPNISTDDDEVTIAERMTFFDGSAVNQTLVYARQGFAELRQELLDAIVCAPCADTVETSSEDNDFLDYDDEGDNENGNMLHRDDSNDNPSPWRTRPAVASRRQSIPGPERKPLLYSGLPSLVQSHHSSASGSRLQHANEQNHLLV